jgi:hypothetical protein
MLTAKTWDEFVNKVASDRTPIREKYRDLKLFIAGRLPSGLQSLPFDASGFFPFLGWNSQKPNERFFCVIHGF